MISGASSTLTHRLYLRLIAICCSNIAIDRDITTWRRQQSYFLRHVRISRYRCIFAFTSSIEELVVQVAINLIAFATSLRSDAVQFRAKRKMLMHCAFISPHTQFSGIHKVTTYDAYYLKACQRVKVNGTHTYKRTCTLLGTCVMDDNSQRSNWNSQSPKVPFLISRGFFQPCRRRLVKHIRFALINGPYGSRHVVYLQINNGRQIQLIHCQQTLDTE